MRRINALTGITFGLTMVVMGLNPNIAFADGDEDDKPVISAPAEDAEVDIDLHAQIESLEDLVYAQGGRLKVLEEAAGGDTPGSAPNVEVSELRKQNAALARRIEALEAKSNAGYSVDGDIAAITAEMERVDLFYQEWCKALELRIDAVEEVNAAQDIRLGDLSDDVEGLQAWHQMEDNSFWRLSAGVGTAMVIRPSDEMEGLRLLPARMGGGGLRFSAFAEGVSGLPLALGATISGDVYGHKGFRASGEFKAYVTPSDTFAVGLGLGIGQEWLGVYDDQPYLYGGATSGLVTANLRWALGNTDLSSTDLTLWGGIAPTQDVLQGNNQVTSVNGVLGLSLERSFRLH